MKYGVAVMTLNEMNNLHLAGMTGTTFHALKNILLFVLLYKKRSPLLSSFEKMLRIRKEKLYMLFVIQKQER